MSSIRSRAPVASSPGVRRVMQANVGRQTTAERTARRSLHAAGLRYRKDVRPERDLRCTADIVFPRYRVCVFIDGCFWHGCPDHFNTPKANAAWWAEKILANIERDARQTALLLERGWVVLRFWEHEIDRVDRIVRAVQKAIRPGRPRVERR